MLVVFLCRLFNLSISKSGVHDAAMSLLPLNPCAITTAYPGNPIQNQDFIFFFFTDDTGKCGHGTLKTAGYQSTAWRLYWSDRRRNVSTLLPATGQPRDLALPVRTMSGTVRNQAA